MSNIRSEFQAHVLNENGIVAVEKVRELYSALLTALEGHCGLVAGGDRPNSREIVLMRTKLEESCMATVRAIAMDPAYQASGVR